MEPAADPAAGGSARRALGWNLTGNNKPQVRALGWNLTGNNKPQVRALGWDLTGNNKPQVRALGWNLTGNNKPQVRALRWNLTGIKKPHLRALGWDLTGIKKPHLRANMLTSACHKLTAKCAGAANPLACLPTLPTKGSLVTRSYEHGTLDAVMIAQPEFSPPSLQTLDPKSLLDVPPQGTFDAVVIAHNGKCANRLVAPAGAPLVAKQVRLARKRRGVGGIGVVAGVQECLEEGLEWNLCAEVAC
eukprot:366005-Chlamydomonas_euryale.AAC.3